MQSLQKDEAENEEQKKKPTQLKKVINKRYAG